MYEMFSSLWQHLVSRAEFLSQVLQSKTKSLKCTEGTYITREYINLIIEKTYVVCTH